MKFVKIIMSKKKWFVHKDGFFFYNTTIILQILLAEVGNDCQESASSVVAFLIKDSHPNNIMLEQLYLFAIRVWRTFDS